MWPLVSVIVLNYQGKKIIEENLSSLLKLDYPPHRYEIIVVDNNSSDGSQKIVQDFSQRFPCVSLIQNKRNLGFSAGNNIGIKAAQGKYVVLLNNDCIVEKRWLKELVSIAERDEKIFSVGSKLLFYPRYFSFSFSVPSHFTIEAIELIDSRLQLLSGKSIPLPFIQKKKAVHIEVPVLKNDMEVKIEVKANGKDKVQNEGESIESKGVVLTNSDRKQRTTLLVKVPKHSTQKIQSAGIVVFQDGYARDRGAVVNYHTQNYEDDNGQYDNETEVAANCAAAVLYRKECFQDFGYLDEHFFMYYEDVEIGERARKRGYRNIFSPKAIVHHLHAFSSTEWSNFFLYHVEKGRLLHLLKHFPMRTFLYQYLHFVLSSFYIFLRGVWHGRLEITRLRVAMTIFFFVLISLPYAHRNNAFLYDEIVNGKWLIKNI